MVTDTRKLHLIEALLKTNSDKVLAEVEAVLEKSSTNTHAPTKLSDRFAGNLSTETAKKLQDHIVKSRDEWERDI